MRMRMGTMEVRRGRTSREEMRMNPRLGSARTREISRLVHIVRLCPCRLNGVVQPSVHRWQRIVVPIESPSRLPGGEEK